MITLDHYHSCSVLRNRLRGLLSFFLYPNYSFPLCAQTIHNTENRNPLFFYFFVFLKFFCWRFPLSLFSSAVVLRNGQVWVGEDLPIQLRMLPSSVILQHCLWTGHTFLTSHCLVRVCRCLEAKSFELSCQVMHTSFLALNLLAQGECNFCTCSQRDSSYICMQRRCLFTATPPNLLFLLVDC